MPKVPIEPPTMRAFAIRQKSTGFYLPAHKPGERGFSFDEPREWRPGSRFGPRLFLTEKSAFNALVAWCRGKFDKNYTRSVDFSGGEDDYEGVKCVPVPGRKREDMEIVTFRLVPEKAD